MRPSGGGSRPIPGVRRSNSIVAAAAAPLATPTSVASSSASLTAAALQDHLTRRLGLTTALKPPPPLASRGKSSRTTGSVTVGTAGAVSAVSSTRGPQTASRHQPPAAPVPVTPETVAEVARAELVPEIDDATALAKPPKLTLAQKMGIFAPPKPPMTLHDWATVHQQSRARGDSHQPCAICQEYFGREPQVLLSCSHVFHQACLRSYELFSRSASCPLCRREQYEKRLIHDGEQVLRERCATKIQAVWRMFVARRAFLRHVPADPRLRRQYHLRRLDALARQAERAVAAQSDAIDRLFAEIDETVARSNQVFRVPLAVDWLAVQQQAVARGDTDCAICIQELHSGGAGGGHRACTLLSCSHVFHQHCLAAFESFNVSGRKNTCPVCRSVYTRRALA